MFEYCYINYPFVSCLIAQKIRTHPLLYVFIYSPMHLRTLKREGQLRKNLPTYFFKVCLVISKKKDKLQCTCGPTSERGAEWWVPWHLQQPQEGFCSLSSNTPILPCSSAPVNLAAGTTRWANRE